LIWERNGVLLAGNEPRYEVWVDRQAVNIDQLLREIAPMLALPPQDVRAALSGEQQRVMLATDLSMDLGERLVAKNVWGVDVIPYWRRIYPNHALAAGLLGFYSADGKGYYGLEGFYDAMLAGEQRIYTEDRDVWQERLPLGAPIDASAQPGADLILTIDHTVQTIVEDELTRALETTGAENGIIIVMDPRTGEILALASAPGYDPNQYTRIANSDPTRFVDPAVSDTYEPGSVFKVITLAAALDSGLVTPETTYYDTACLEVGGQSLCNWDRQGHGEVSMTTMMARSLNVGAATLSTRMGAAVFYNYVHAFGFGQATGVDLQGEVHGHVRQLGNVDWYESDLGTNAFGQGISVTPLQMITAIAAVANDGVLVRPHLVKAIVDGDHVREAHAVEIGRAIRADTARTLSQMLVDAVAQEVPQAQVPGYRIAGKTGTAQIPIAGGYDDPWTIGSFVGYGPASDPRLIILVRLDRPTIAPWGSATAAPVFKSLATRLFGILGIAPDATRALASN
jgi:cell division protein FtsI/penicillin-binding protein 2